ncbi:MAG: hypothetical protein UIM53_00215 [Acutalibacteraceae bacterium]|nr:hypothetical protein [Acutalibacteraceae bacterium]
MKNIKFAVKIFALCIMLLIISVVLGGCGETYTQVENLMKITDDFVGERVITLDLGTDFDKNEERTKNLEKVIQEDCPPNMSYRTEKKDGSYRCVFVLSFSSLEEYKTKVASVIGKQIAVAYGYTDTVLSKGTYYKEDFDGMELVSWLTDNLYEKGYKDLVLDMQSTSNVVKYNNEVFSSKTSVLNTSTVKGQAVDSVTIDTVNYKNGSYDRTLILSVPITTYNSLGASLEELMKTRVAKEAKFSRWTSNNGLMEFTVKYEKIDIERLQEYTKLFVECHNQSIYYGDQNQSSTPLAEQLVFEEKINLLNMVSGSEKNVKLIYNYTLPEETTHGEGVELSKGEWKTSGSWSNNTYKISNTDGVYDIRVPDGMQYAVKGINIELSALDNDTFRREVDFIYDRNTGDKGLNYAYNFLASKGFTVSKESIAQGIVCRITQQGTSNDINNAVSELFGSGNYFECTRHTNDLSVVTDIMVEDNINITYMLTGANTDIDINYTVKSEGTEYIRSVKADNKADKVSVDITMKNDNSYTSTIKGGNFSVIYTATVPFTDGIIMYCMICGTIIVITLLTILLLMRYNRKLKKKEQLKALRKELSEKEKTSCIKPKTDEQLQKEKEDKEYDDFLKEHYNF